MRKTIYFAGGIVLLLLAGFSLLFWYATRLDDEISLRFEGKRWSLPATVYARPLELYLGQRLSAAMVEEELLLSGYRQGLQLQGEGSYSRDGGLIELISRGFHFPSGFEPSRHLRLRFSADSVSALSDGRSGEELSLARIDPARIGSFHPIVHEDRIVLESQEIPPLLRQSLLVVEDQNFYRHFGIAPLAIVRALLANIRAGSRVQGGSTITQQLVKNLFLTPERTLSRKIKEALMAVVLDWRYSKEEILTTYLNEVFLGQDGNRAIHGFALAGQHYFRRALNDLSPAQIAMLVGMVKGPSLYDPRRNPEGCRQRRQLVLARMADAGLIDQETFHAATAAPLLDSAGQSGGFNRFPAFLDLVRQQLAVEYQEVDLKTDGLQVLTTLDPRLQFEAERNLLETIGQLEAEGRREQLEGAMVLSNRDNGEVLALVGGRVPQQGTFNRALQARRPIGSLVKPAVYLAALAHGYGLASPVNDTQVTLTGENGQAWQPQNYDRREHGTVALYAALANSYNLATVQLGLALGLAAVTETLQQLGFPEEIPQLPSLLLGAVAMTPFEVTQIYQTLAADGFYTPLRAINAVQAADKTTLSRYGLSVEQRFPSEAIFLLNYALQRVMDEGTGRAVLASPLAGLRPAGKTGTTNELRDSWFAGFTGEHLAVVWLGRDDNRPIDLTGAGGALAVWMKVLAAIQSAPLVLTEPPGITWQRFNRQTLRPVILGDSLLLPVVAAPTQVPAVEGLPQPERSRPPPAPGKGLIDSIRGLLRQTLSTQ